VLSSPSRRNYAARNNAERAEAFMNITTSRGLPRRLPLAGCLAIAFSIANANGFDLLPAGATAQRPIQAPRVIVQNCDDSGAGSLRDSIQNAGEGDTIDLTQLACSTITLSSGAITIFQNELTLDGPGPGLLTIDGDAAQQIIKDFGYTTLTIRGLTLTRGYLSNGFTSAGGGCIYTRTTDLVVSHSVISNCESYDTVAAYGGAIFTLHNLTIENSIVTGNTARAGSVASGGGALVDGDFVLDYSTLSDNTVITATGRANEFGGGAHTFGNVTIDHSTISGNKGHLVAGLFLEEFNGYYKIGTITDSTISGNDATLDGAVGGLRATITLGIYNSTIAFNSGTLAGGVYAEQPLTLQSSIIAQDVGDDLLVAGGAAELTGDHDLIQSGTTVPPGTIRDDPDLLPLADNGGATWTHALAITSPAIDTGSNPLALDTDQRGPGYARVSGPAADIGAFETQEPADRIFANGFDP
jgi:hypothetical protein